MHGSNIECSFALLSHNIDVSESSLNILQSLLSQAGAPTKSEIDFYFELCVRLSVCHVCLLASVPFPSVSVLHIPLFISLKTSELASETAKREPAYVIFEFASKM